MSSFTSKTVRDLYEAYNSVYIDETPVYGSQKLTEENVWEEVENWVNSLIDEGHDLSEYTWGEMYIFYLNEASGDIEAAGGDFGRWLKKKGKESFNLSKDVLGAQYQGWMGKKTTSKNPVTQAVNLGARITTTPLRDYAVPFVKGMVSNAPSASPKPALKPATAKPKPAPTSTKPQQKDFGRESGEYLAPSRGSSRAADPVVRAGGGYGFFGAVVPPSAKTKSKPQAQPQPKPQPSGTSVKRDPRGAVIVNHLEIEDASLVTEAPAQVAPIKGTGGRGWYQKNKQGKYVPITDPELAKQAAARWKAERAKQKQTQAQTQTQPQPPRQQEPKPQKPAAAKPKPAPESPAVREYMKAAAAARKSGDAAQMAKVRDTGLDIWRKKYANTLAKNVTPAGTQRGTGQSVMAKQADELRALRPAAPQSTTSTPEPQAQSKLSGGAYSPAATARMSQRTKNVLGVKEQYDACDLVLEYLFSNGQVDTLEEAIYVMMEMSAETIQDIIQERAWWDPAGVFMSGGEKKVEKAKSTPTGYGSSYNPNTGLTYNPNARDPSRATGVLAPKGGVMGTMEPGKPSTWQRYAPGSDPYRRQNIDRYTTVRGRDQIRQDDIRNQAAKNKARRDAAATADFDRRYGVNNPPGDEFAAARKNTRVSTQPETKTRSTSKPATTKTKPQSIQSKNVTTTGTSYERRTPTSAELAAARRAGGGEAGIKAAVDVAKTNKVAATSPTPDLKPEAPNRESLMKQAADLKATRERIEKEGIKSQKINSSYEYDAFDLVLEYLLSQGHVDTLEEALYVMMEMSSETVQEIVEGIMPEPINPEVHRRLQRIEKATKLQQGTKGAESQAAGSAVKRMGGSGVQLPGV